jgi:hypothetical protein
MWKRIALIALLFAVAASQTIPQTSNTEINLLLSKLPANVETKRYKGYVPPLFNETTLKSLYLPMRDGVEYSALAGHVHEPRSQSDRRFNCEEII